ncbi:MAG: universal stress protein [Candidatus Nitrosotalea sp.]|nr:universal stress protein [Candidatus Nitrosotalea sp.]
MVGSNIFKNILVPYDGSKYSRRAIAHAIKIAKKFESSVFLVTEVNTSDFPPGMLLALIQKDKLLEKSINEFMVAVKSQARKELLAEVAVCKEKGVNAYYDIIVGTSPAEAILKFVRGRKIDLIIIGSQGLHGIGKIKALGSVSRKISELANCPVLIIHE